MALGVNWVLCICYLMPVESWQDSLCFSPMLVPLDPSLSFLDINHLKLRIKI